MTESIENSANRSPRGEHLFCAYCGTEDKSDFGYCDHCGERVTALDSARFTSHELGKCQVCSTQNQVHAKHCMGCGVALEDKELITGGRPEMDFSLKDAAYPDPLDPDAPPEPGQVSPAEPDKPLDDRRRPPYARTGRADANRAQSDDWSSDDVREDSGRPDRDGYGSRNYKQAEADGSEFNDSGTAEAELPSELKGYNWGAMLLGPIWGLGNRTWVATILFALWIVPVPPVVGLPLYLLGSLYLGSHANRWAWRSKKWMSIRHFKRSQQNWAFWGFIISPVIVFSILTIPFWSSGS